MCQSNMSHIGLAVPTGFEPATSGLTGRRALQAAPRDRECLSYLDIFQSGDRHCAPPTGFEPVFPP